jgi:hypothetical protein
VLHTCRAVVLAQTLAALPGMHSRGLQAPAPVHE